MSIPKKPGKLDGEAIIEPAGANICYDSALCQWISTRPDRNECDGWLVMSLLLSSEVDRNLVSGQSHLVF